MHHWYGETGRTSLASGLHEAVCVVRSQIIAEHLPAEIVYSSGDYGPRSGVSSVHAMILKQQQKIYLLTSRLKRAARCV